MSLCLEGSQSLWPKAWPLLPLLRCQGRQGTCLLAQATDLLREKLWASPGAWISLSPPSAAF